MLQSTRSDLVAGEDDGESLGPPRAHQVVKPGEVLSEDGAVEEQQRRERLVLRRRRDLALGRERAEEGAQLGGTERRGILAAVELVVAAHPAEVRFFGPQAEVLDAHGGARAVAEPWPAPAVTRVRSLPVRAGRCLAKESRAAFAD